MGCASSRRSNACAAFDDAEFAIVVRAAEEYISAKNAFTRFVSVCGDMIASGYSKLPEDWQEIVSNKVRDILQSLQNASTIYMDDELGKESSNDFYAGLVIATGASAGTIGLPGLIVELPATTMVFFRSIADIARSVGHDLRDPIVQATCFETFAYGGPLEDDDDADMTFFAARLGSIEVSAVIASIAVRYTANLAPKVAAQAVPMVGAIFGAGINFGFLRFYQAMARVLFTLLPLEQKYERDRVRSCFASIVNEINEAKRRRR